MVKVLIFDFDGLILDTELPEYRGWQEIYAEHGHELPIEIWGRGIGTVGGFNPYDYLEQLKGQGIERAEIKEKVRARVSELIEAEKILPGIEEYISEAKKLGLKVGLASSSHHAWADTHLTRLGLFEHFDCVRCADDVEIVKPNPALYQAVLDYFEIDGSEAIAFEDSPNGIRAAKSAGIFCVAVPNKLTSQLRVEMADMRLNSLADMPLSELLQMVEKR